jgi:hypothetical protein
MPPYKLMIFIPELEELKAFGCKFPMTHQEAYITGNRLSQKYGSSRK